MSAALLRPIPSLLGAPVAELAALRPGEVALLGLFLDHGDMTRFGGRFGARFAARQIRYASATSRLAAPEGCLDLGDLNVFPLEPARNHAALVRQLDLVRAAGGRPVLVGGRLSPEGGLAQLLPDCRAWSPGEALLPGPLAVTLDLASLRWPGAAPRPLAALLEALRTVPPAAIAAAHLTGLAPELDETGMVEASLGVHVLRELVAHMLEAGR
jgi:hypothetical protein